ncbi:hypothetical protein BKA63DRAFT_519536 [Paraphoma chrysanthemicola]|nr:hypothetical protein BKA63DRAFT_519536 [Paraphoma chrysanthemicola]
MKLTFVAIVAAASSAAAADCQKGLTYCGSTLIKKDPKYRAQMEAIIKTEVPSDVKSKFKSLDEGLNNSTWYCGNWLEYLGRCGTRGCIDGGANKDDRCGPMPQIPPCAYWPFDAPGACPEYLPGGSKWVEP